MWMKDFLAAVAAGKTGFQADGDSDESLAAFQATVATAEEALGLGLIEFLKPHQESYSAGRYVDALLVGELTPLGREQLRRYGE
jgi:hypothetical protein